MMWTWDSLQERYVSAPEVALEGIPWGFNDNRQILVPPHLRYDGDGEWEDLSLVYPVLASIPDPLHNYSYALNEYGSVTGALVMYANGTHGAQPEAPSASRIPLANCSSFRRFQKASAEPSITTATWPFKPNIAPRTCTTRNPAAYGF